MQVWGGDDFDARKHTNANFLWKTKFGYRMHFWEGKIGKYCGG